MKKFAVFSGFLGSGKTTSMMALTKYFSQNHGRAAMISNDLGGPGLCDNRLANLSGCSASELTGTCICYQTENLVNRLNELFDKEGCELVISDIPGFGVGALDHVYHKLSAEYPGQFPLAPFTVVCEPETVKKLQSGTSPELSYIFRSQLREADLIVLNKCDLISETEKAQMLEWLQKEFYPAQCIGISALSSQGLEELSQKLINGTASMRKPDLSYGGSEFTAAMGSFSEYNIQYYAEVCCDTFDGNAYLRQLAEKIRAGISEISGAEIPHLKLLSWVPEGDYAKADILGIQREIEFVKTFSQPCRNLAVIINTSAQCNAAALEKLISSSIEEISEKYQLSIMIYKKECFNALGES